MRSRFIISLVFLFVSTVGFSKIYSVTIEYTVFSDCKMYVTFFFDDNDTTDPTDDRRMGQHIVLKCGGKSALGIDEKSQDIINLGILQDNMNQDNNQNTREFNLEEFLEIQRQLESSKKPVERLD